MRETVDFLLLYWLGIPELVDRSRFSEHSLGSFGQALDTCEQIAREKFRPFNRLVDAEEPRIEGDSMVHPEATREAWDAYAASGLLAASQDYEDGGMQLPFVVETAGNAFFLKGSVGLCTGPSTAGVARVITAHGSARQKLAFSTHLLTGKFAGTLCLGEPQADAGWGDIETRAWPDGDGHGADPLGARHRLLGLKTWVCAGDHELNDNIVHLVLAKIPGADGRTGPGAKDVSLFVVPKKLIGPDGQPSGERNDVVLDGLAHKCGWRGTTTARLHLGDGRHLPHGKPGAVGYLVGEAGHGLAYVSQMLREARIGAGLAAAMLGMAGFEASLAYARVACQGLHARAPGRPDWTPQVPLIELADVKRMLLAQKAYSEGALALQLRCARLIDDVGTGAPATAREARALLEVLVPVAKSWPGEWCLEANSLAIQVFGSAGYTREFPVEQHWRDNRLNMIHHGTHGAHGLELLGDKVLMDDGDCLTVLLDHMERTAVRALDHPGLRGHSADLAHAAGQLRATRASWSTGEPDETLANATPYLQAVGHVVLAWIWLDVLCCVEENAADLSPEFIGGKRSCARYFFRFELPKIGAWLGVVTERESVCRLMRNDWY